jgi:signal peptidase I
MLSAPQTRAEVTLVLATQVLRTFGELRFVARGSSMIPTIYPGDILLVARQPAANVGCGQVVLTSRGGRFCAHRVIRKMEEGGRQALITRGDALVDEDPPVSEHDLLGRVTAVVRGRKRIELAEKQRAGKKLLRWAVRHSDVLAAWLLRWNSLRTRIARNPRVARAESSEEFVECI